jgi:hypothetical protein
MSQDLSGIASALIGAAMSQRPPIVYYRNRIGTEPRIHSRSKGNSERQNEPQRTADTQLDTARQQHEAFLKIAPAAKELIDDASTFVKENSTNVKLVTFIKKINELNSALAAEDPAKIKPLMEGLVGDLRHETGYAKLEAARIKQKQEEAARYLPELINIAKQQQAFIRYQITNNPTALYTGTFIQSLESLDTALAAPDLERLRTLTSKVDVSIREVHLQDEFIKSKNILSQLDSNASGPDRSRPMNESNMLRKTDNNAFLVDGDMHDIIVLYNASTQSANVTKSLSGAITFENGNATGCLYTPNFDNGYSQLLKQKLISEFQLLKLVIDSSECSRIDLLTYDVIAVERGQFVQMQSQNQVPLYSELEANHFKQLMILTSGELNRLAIEQKKDREKILADIENGSGDGYGIVGTSQHATAICLVINDREDGHRQLLQDQVELSTSNIIRKSTLDDAYKAIQHNECQAVYSSSGELKRLTAALMKDGANYSVAVVWNTEEEINKADKFVQEKREAETKQGLIAKTERESNEALRAKMNAEESASAKARQLALRSEFGNVAAAYSAAIAKDIRELADRRDDWQQSAAYTQFPKFVTGYQNLIRSHWELQSFSSEIEDYGHAEWKGRTMETGFALINIRLRNRILGEYKDLCLIVGRMNDVEFGVMRGPTEFACEDAAQLSSLKKARNFESQWLVQPKS